MTIPSAMKKDSSSSDNLKYFLLADNELCVFKNNIINNESSKEYLEHEISIVNRIKEYTI